MSYTPIVGTLGYVMSADGRRVLLIHRNARHDDDHLGKYNGLGGKMEADEDVVGCMRREIREEAGIECKSLVLRGTINWTGILSEPGAIPSPALSGRHSKSITWNTRCESDNGIVGGIMGTVSFTPSFACTGSMKAYVIDAGLQPPGSVGTIAAGFAAAYNPYVGAAVLFANWTLGSKSHANYGVIGESIIENGSGTVPKVDATASTTSTGPTVIIALSPLSLSVAQTAGVPDFTVRGTYDITSKLQAHDDSISSEVYAYLKPDVIGAMAWKSTRPTYAPAP